MIRPRLTCVLCCAAVAALMSWAPARVEAQGPTKYIAYDIPAGTVGNQANHTGSLGLDFDVQLDILITRIGVFDSGSDGLAQTITARIVDRDTLEDFCPGDFTPEDPGAVGGGRVV